MFNSIFPKIHKEGYKFLAISILATFIVLFFSEVLGLIFILITIWIYYFFRDPERFSINDDSYLVSPADGLVTDISERSGPEELRLENTTYTRVSVFMNVFNCHVNRSPIAGKVMEINYRPGKFFNASLDKASVDNERNSLVLQIPDGRQIIVVQIAGLVARRIVSFVKPKQTLRIGQRFGLIRFGSRVDIYLPTGVQPLVCLGQTMVSGETVIADLTSKELARDGRKE